MPRLTPYDSGDVLEPQVWVSPVTHMVGVEQLRAAEPEDWGKVEFENDESMAEIVVKVVRVGADLRLEVERLTDMDELEITVDGTPIWRSDQPAPESSESSVPDEGVSTIGGTPA